MFAIVQFWTGASSAAEVVPVKWFNEALGKCVWPPDAMSPYEVNKVISKSADPDGSWESFEATLEATFSKYRSSCTRYLTFLNYFF